MIKIHIYIILNKINNKIYIGKTIKDNIQKRFKEHIYKAHSEKLKSNMLIVRAISKYGEENFEIKSLFETNNFEELNQKEKEYIKLYNSQNPLVGYNYLAGGEGVIPTPEFKKIMSEKAKKRIGKLNPFFNKTHSDEQKAKWSKMRKGVVAYIPTDEQKEKSRINSINLWKDENYRKKTINAIKESKKNGLKEIPKKYIKVKCIELNKEFNSIKECAKQLTLLFKNKKFSESNIISVCRGNKKTHNGLTFKYVDENRIKTKNKMKKCRTNVFVKELNKTFSSKVECAKYLTEYTGTKYFEKYISNNKKYKQFTFIIN